MILNHASYVPVLRWKQAESQALQEAVVCLGKAQCKQLMPLLEITPQRFRAKDGKRLPVGSALRTIAIEIDTNWTSSPLFVDLAPATNAGIEMTDEGEHLLEGLAQATRKLHPLFPEESNLIPVTGLSRSPDYQRAVGSLVEKDKLGVGIRLTLRDIADAGLSRRLEALLSQLRLEAPDAHLIVDLEFLNGSCPDLQTLCSALPQLSRWRNFIVLGGAFPKDLQGPDVKEIGVHKLRRDEWFYWEQVLTLPRKMRCPTFGDYTIQHSIFEEPPEYSNPSASIRYTHSDNWVIIRGEGLKNKDSPGHAQYPAEAKLLCEMDEFCGPTFSPGDLYIYETSRNAANTGSPTTWLKAGINHHLVFTSRQLRDFAQEHRRHFRLESKRFDFGD